MINHFVRNGFQSGWDVLPVKSDLQGIVSHPSFPSCTQSAPLKCDVCGSFQLYCSQKPWWQISSALTVCAVLWNDCRSATVRERMTPGIGGGDLQTQQVATLHYSRVSCPHTYLGVPLSPHHHHHFPGKYFSACSMGSQIHTSHGIQRAHSSHLPPENGDTNQNSIWGLSRKEIELF